MTTTLETRIAELDALAARQEGYKARAEKIVDRVLPALPVAHGFYDPHGFVAASRRLSERKRLYWRTFARLRAKAEGGVPYIAIPKNSAHLFGPGDAMFDVAMELAAAALQVAA